MAILIEVTLKTSFKYQVGRVLLLGEVMHEVFGDGVKSFGVSVFASSFTSSHARIKIYHNHYESEECAVLLRYGHNNAWRNLNFAFSPHAEY